MLSGIRQDDRARQVVALFAAPLPWALKRTVYQRVLGYVVDPSARVGLSLVAPAALTLGPGARIGHLVRIAGRLDLRLDAEAGIGSQSTLYGPPPHYPDWPGLVHFGPRARLLGRGFIDGGGTVRLGQDVLLAGREVQVWSHGPTFRDGRWRQLLPAEVRVGANVYVGARAQLLPGADVPERCIVSAGAVVLRTHEPYAPGTVLVGNPARPQERRATPPAATT